MRIILLFILIFLISCEQYVVEISDLSLSGKYVVNRLDVTSVDQSKSKDSLYLLGSTFYDNNLPHPFNKIEINRFYIHLDHSSIRLNLLGVTQDGRDVWEYGSNEPIFYRIFGNNSYNSGYIEFNYFSEGKIYRRMIFLIEHDGIETLQLRTTGTWIFGSEGEKQTVTLYLTRVGP